MKKILVEGQFGHGGKRSFIGRTIRRGLIRSRLGMASIPFDWGNGYHVRPLKIKNQGVSSSCGGQAKSRWLEIVLNIVEQSAKSVYSPIAFPGGGTTVPSLEKDSGSVDESIVPSYLGGNPPSEPYMTDLSWRTPDTLKNTLKKVGWKAVSVPIDIESIAKAIRDNEAVIWEIQGRNNGTWLSNNPKPPLAKDGIWTHFMCSQGAGLWNNKKSIDMFQSWGEEVGDAGIQHFTEDYINSGYIIDCFTFLKIPKYQFNTDFGMYTFRFTDVYNLQKILIVGGYGSFIPTGFFGSLTQEALEKFQSANNIPATGFCGQITRALLNS